MRSLLVLAACMAIGCGSRTIGDGFDIDTNIPEDGAVTSDTAGSDGIATSDSIPPNTDGGTVEPSRIIRCGMDTCVATSEDCCISSGGASECRPRGTCGRGAVLSCSSPASCGGGDACCFSFRDGPKATCQKACTGRDPALCDTDADCTMGRRCRPSMFGGFHVCQ